MKAMGEDKMAGEIALKRSDVNWTIVYATRLTDGPKAGHRIVPPGERVTSKDHITRADVAEFLPSRLEDDSSIHRPQLITSM